MIVLRSLLVAFVASVVSFAAIHSVVVGAAFLAGSCIGLAYLFHIATGFDRLVKAGQKYLPFLILESLLRVFVVAAAPFVIMPHGPALGYFLYLAGFVAPLAVVIATIRQQNTANSAQTNAF
jgi:uncharacterized membrane protein